MAYLAEEPVDLERPEAGECVEKKRVGVRSVVSSEESHDDETIFINYYCNQILT